MSRHYSSSKLCKRKTKTSTRDGTEFKSGVIIRTRIDMTVGKQLLFKKNFSVKISNPASASTE